MKKTMMITLMFAFGHGLMLFLFAKLLELYALPESITGYGDTISSTVIIVMGLYLLFMVATNRIQLNKHMHENKEHIHIYFGKEHSHHGGSSASAWTVGALMGIGGVRGMLVTLGMLQGSSVEWTMVLAFIAGVSLVFVSFGFVILQLNSHVLTTIRNVRLTFSAAGLISVLIGSQMLMS
jgi:nickel/cobalt exporter